MPDLRCIFIADFHSGSFWSLRPPEVVLPTPALREAFGLFGTSLYEGYCRIIEEHKRPDVLCSVGDMVEGPAKKDGSRIVWSSDMTEQANVAVGLVDMWEAAEVYGVRGTKYHVESGDNPINADEYVMKHVKNGIPLKGRFAPAHQYLDLMGCVVHISHKIGGSRVWQYRGTPLARELALNRIMSRESEVYHANLIVRAHVHHYYEIRAGANSRVTVCPAWKVQDDYAASENPFAWTSQIGVLEVEITDGRVTKAEPILIDSSFQRPPLVVAGIAARRRHGRNAPKRRRVAR